MIMVEEGAHCDCEDARERKQRVYHYGRFSKAALPFLLDDVAQEDHAQQDASNEASDMAGIRGLQSLK